MTKKDSIVEAADELYQRALDVEDNFFQLTQTGRGDDGLRAPGGLGFSRLSAHVGSADFAPTEQASEVYEELAQTMKTYRSLFEEMMESELAPLQHHHGGREPPPHRDSAALGFEAAV